MGEKATTEKGTTPTSTRTPEKTSIRVVIETTTLKQEEVSNNKKFYDAFSKIYSVVGNVRFVSY